MNCKNCNKPLKENANVCKFCNEKIKSKDEKNTKNKKLGKKVNLENNLSAIKSVTHNNLTASTRKGEMTLILPANIEDNILPNDDLMPSKYILQSLKKLLRNMKSLIRDKKKRKPAIIITLIWTIIMIFNNLFDSNTIPFNIINFLTFSNGGTSGGLIGVVGGNIGKGVFAYFITTLIMPLIKGKKPFSFIKGGFIDAIKIVGNREIRTKAHAFLGIGLALILYNFMSSDASLSNSMIGIASLIMSIRMLSRKTGFLRGLIISFIGKYSKNKNVESLSVNRIISGFALGFALSVILSTTGISFIGYLVGSIFLIVSFIIKIIFKDTEKPNKEVTV